MKPSADGASFLHSVNVNPVIRPGNQQTAELLPFSRPVSLINVFLSDVCLSDPCLHTNFVETTIEKTAQDRVESNVGDNEVSCG